MEQVDCTERTAVQESDCSKLTSVGLDASSSVQHICRESALDLLMHYRHPKWLMSRQHRKA